MPVTTPQESPLEDATRRKRNEDYLHAAGANASNNDTGVPSGLYVSQALEDYSGIGFC